MLRAVCSKRICLSGLPTNDSIASCGKSSFVQVGLRFCVNVGRSIKLKPQKVTKSQVPHGSLSCYACIASPEWGCNTKTLCHDTVDQNKKRIEGSNSEQSLLSRWTRDRYLTQSRHSAKISTV
uniref:AlNc14C78G5157 protein n=1 Tax=Albugo laibachii Nc14 TaxID=890382 RepID=F0WEV9_9STRA|nr:AlNc14C78G5157 [Albugo laibachii Nc14]|eukprot:CCA19741.1 AlNc14C78G5157 [Albugo laibachii Nc14]